MLIIKVKNNKNFKAIDTKNVAPMLKKSEIEKPTQSRPELKSYILNPDRNLFPGLLKESVLVRLLLLEPS